MPVEGYKNKRVWQYTFRPQPYSILDRGWDIHDREWEHNLVERLRRGEAAPRSLSVYEAVQGSYRINAEQGWESAEEYSKNANRINATFLNDEAIAHRKPARELRKKAWAEQEARNREYWEKEWVRREEQEKKDVEARIERDRVYAEHQREKQRIMEEKIRIRKEQDAEWNAAEQEAIRSAQRKSTLSAEEFQRRVKASNADFWYKFKESNGDLNHFKVYGPEGVIGGKYGPSK
jgi:hypothetical protein